MDIGEGPQDEDARPESKATVERAAVGCYLAAVVCFFFGIVGCLVLQVSDLIPRAIGELLGFIVYFFLALPVIPALLFCVGFVFQFLAWMQERNRKKFASSTSSVLLSEQFARCDLDLKRRPASETSRSTAALLAVVLGGFGVHHIYLARTRLGFVYLCFFWTAIPFILAFVEGIRFLCMSDAEFAARNGGRRARI